ncbi:MAG: hypothetical protein ACYC1U_05840 [Candidatus Aquicultorales bacterium]
MSDGNAARWASLLGVVAGIVVSRLVYPIAVSIQLAIGFTGFTEILVIPDAKVSLIGAAIAAVLGGLTAGLVAKFNGGQYGLVVGGIMTLGAFYNEWTLHPLLDNVWYPYPGTWTVFFAGVLMVLGGMFGGAVGSRLRGRS